MPEKNKIPKIKKPDKEEAEETFVGNCAGEIIFVCGNPPMGYCLPSNKPR